MKEIIECVIRFKAMCDEVTFETCVDGNCQYKEVCNIMTSSTPDSWSMKKIIELKTFENSV